jgi:hypothetical protein
MKLYTEEQVKEAYNLGFVDGYDVEERCENSAISLLTPIELLSDEEIKSYSDRYSTMHEDVSDKLGQYLVSAIHIDGAKWLKEHIFNQNK